VQPDYDVVIIGAGAAGLAAARDLRAAGMGVCCVEARARIGGRILTARDADTPMAIELGAEFVHGRPSEIFELDLNIYETGGRPVSVSEEAAEDQEEESEDILGDVARTASEENDETFQSFIDRSSYPEWQKKQATAFVEGFNAARREVIGTAALAHDQRAVDKIEGDRTFRIREGYDAVIAWLAAGIEVRLNCAVDKVRWRPGEVELLLADGSTVSGRRAVITAPLGVLQAGAIGFDPEPHAILEAARALRFGDAFRVTFLFEQAFWDESPRTADAGFLFSDEPVFPVWWTGRPVEPRAITGWTAGPKADALLGLPGEQVVTKAVAVLRRILNVPVLPPHSAWFHDWHADPFSRGAYSYVPAGALPARRVLAEPVEDTLYFAGEATDLLGYGGTVHGAIASGRRAAKQIVGGKG
jgi:monoamine oxidase